MSEEDEMGRKVIKRALASLNDRDAEQRIEASEEQRERRGELIILGQRAAKGAAVEALIASAEELSFYLASRGGRLEDGAVRLEREGGHAIVATWGGGEVSFSDGSASRVVSADGDGRLTSRDVEDALGSFK